ncbi:cytochrome P450 [Pseudomonas citronellolis]|uniref:cytochrome P450 n=1 Tax=Pseudomonas citronellolis TaxID=53408 RepID=UPI0021C11F59|nr:cytochrome P450 [Pseudomonas citronellolis]UXJ50168.1 cytochrome P450 [Pseudomonas citronellolis]
MGTVKTIEDFDDPSFNPFVEDELVFGDHLDPYAKIAELRRKASVHQGEYRVMLGLYPDITFPKDAPHYSVFGYDEVAQVLGDAQTFTNHAYTYNLGISFGRSVSTMDGPEHSRFRRIFQKAFLPQTVAAWGTEIVDPVVHDLMDKFIGRGEADLVQEFTLHYPLHIIYRQLALPPEDINTFHKLAIAQTIVAVDVEHGTEASRKLGAYFKRLVDERRANPGDDLISALARAEVDGEYLPEDVLVSFLRQLINAGADTTYRATSVLLTGLLRNPDQLEAIRQDRSLIPQAIEEAVRWDGPVLMQTRYASKATTLGGVEIPEGAIIDVVAGSANRDERKFPDPDRFDIFRKPQHRHFAFSFGPHVCIGQHLARVEMTRALTAILDNLPNLRLDPDKPAPEVRGTMMRVPHSIHVKFG